MGCADASMAHQRAARRRGGRLTAASASAAVAAYAPLYSLLLLLAIMLSNACVNAQQGQYLTKPEGLGVALGATVPLKHNAPETEDVEDPMPVVVEVQGEVGANGAGYLMDEEDDFTTADLFALQPEPAPEPAPAPAPRGKGLGGPCESAARGERAGTPAAASPPHRAASMARTFSIDG